MNTIVKNPFAYMQKVTVKTLCIVGTLFFFISGCGDSNSMSENNGDGLTSLIGTSWKLIGSVNGAGKLMLFEPLNCDRCYTITFDADSIILYDWKDSVLSDYNGNFTGYSASNAIHGLFYVDYKTGILHIPRFGGTKVGEIGDGTLYSEIIRNDIHSFKLQRDKLKLYYGKKRNYLLFKRLNP